MSDELNIVKELFNKLESIDKNVDQINITLAVQAEQLRTHIHRTELLEEALKPLQTHVNRVNSLILLLGGIFALIGAIKGILEILKLLS